MLATYRTMRLGLPAIGLALPWVLWIGGRIVGKPLQDSMSAYYFTPMRDEFVGGLIAVGALLILYRGYTQFENWALNLGGIFLAGVALFHMDPPDCGDACGAVNPHGVFAVAFFGCIAYVCIFRSADTLDLLRVKHGNLVCPFKVAYKILGGLMFSSPIIAFILRLMLHPATDGKGPYVFFVEATGVYVFAIYWLLKSYEISQTDSERRALTGGLEMAPHGRQGLLSLSSPFSDEPSEVDTNVTGR